MRKREKGGPKRVWFFKSYYGGRDLFRGKVCFSCLFQKRRGETKGSSHFGEVSAFLLCFFFFVFYISLTLAEGSVPHVDE